MDMVKFLDNLSVWSDYREMKHEKGFIEYKLITGSVVILGNLLTIIFGAGLVSLLLAFLVKNDYTNMGYMELALNQWVGLSIITISFITSYTLVYELIRILIMRKKRN